MVTVHKLASSQGLSAGLDDVMAAPLALYYHFACL